MNLKHWAMSAIVGLLALTGCQSGMYSSDVSVESREGGVSDYTVVPSLPDGDVPASMPVVVESRPLFEHRKGDHPLNGLLWFLTLGVVPGISSETTVYDVTVRTPLGERSGTCTVEACSWFGWLPIFLPYPGSADERATNPKLPNVKLERQTHDRLVANLVSQFPKEEYASYAAKNNSPEMKAKRAQEAAERERVAKERAEAERVRLAKEAAERAKKRHLAAHNALYEWTVKNDLAQIRKHYKDGDRYLSPFFGAKDSKSDWLSRWASPRQPLTEADTQAGEAILAEFGTKYLPNAYANYEKRREALGVLQQVFNEEFPQPWTIKETNPKWNALNKVLERFAKARTEAFLCHDELCHYWLLWRLGALSDRDLVAADAERLSVPLLPEHRPGGITCTELKFLPLKPLDGNVVDFASRYAPESSGLCQRMERELKELDALLAEIGKQRRQLDDVRHSRALEAAVAKRKDLAHELDALSLQLQAWHIEHRTAVKSADDVAQCDADMAKKLRPFIDSLPGYVKERMRMLGPVVIADAELVAIPGRNYRLQRTEVTQRQWLLVMGSNPSRFQGLDRPVENISWDDCQEFIRRASEMDGRRYRLPTEAEWEHACRAGNTGSFGATSVSGRRWKRKDCTGSADDWGKRANGACGPLYVMGWYRKNSGGETHPVAQKEPNAWGLYDMHGNVMEWCQDQPGAFSFSRVFRGGSWRLDGRYCSASYLGHCDHDYRAADLGFRLVVSLD